MKQYIDVLTERYSLSKDQLISEVILKNDGIECAVVDLDRVKLHGTITRWPDGRETFEWDGKPLIEFYPIQTSFDGTKMTVTQKYRTLI
jgi:hypothetical protein